MISQILKSELSSIKDDLLDLRRSMDFLSSMHDDMKKKVDTLINNNALLSKENTALKTTVLDLSDRLNTLEQHLRENNLDTTMNICLIFFSNALK
ncbi:unnamed protein product [Arctia plantaginis]|uniref:Rho-GAP domain-containing protein n=1 Tax=Arctia plantaginis TaxID=874455 RepID=A0A8S0Z3W6_ARCPL|nr:unnamed protein product [Arctia plantaginis]